MVSLYKDISLELFQDFEGKNMNLFFLRLFYSSFLRK